MAASTQGQGRDKLPRDVRSPGPLRNDAVLGLVLFMETRSLGQAAAPGASAPSQLDAGDVGKSKKGRGKGKKAKGGRSDAVMEITLCGGKTPGDVIMFQAWEADVRGRLSASGGVGDTVRIRRCLAVAHTEKTRWHVTSRSPVFLKAMSDTTMERIEARPDFLDYHPVAPIPSLPLLPPRSLVCLAGRVVEASEVAMVDTPDGEADVPVAHLALRSSGDAIRINFWRDTAGLLKDVKKNDLVFLWGVAKQLPKAAEDPKVQVELRATARTRVLGCPQPLTGALADTPADLSGAAVWSARLSSQRKDYVAADATWMSLSVLEALMASRVIRDMNRVFEVPSVFLEFGSQLTYPGCSTCLKAWREETVQPCQCPVAERTHLWRARVGLRDATGQIQAVCFRALEAVVSVYGDASGDDEKAPLHFSTEEVAERLAARVAAVPFTARITVAADGYKEAMEATIQLLTPTFSNAGVKHPLKPVVQVGQAAGACAPFRLAQTSYSEGVGMTEADGAACESFRAVVEFADDAAGVGADGRATRRVRCAYSTGAEAPTYCVEVDGDDHLARILGGAANGASAHALLSWTSPDVIRTVAILPVPPETCEAFKKFFAAEMDLRSGASTDRGSASAGIGATPTKVLSAADLANQTSPPLWKVRKPLDGA